MEKGYIYSLRIPGAIMPQYIGQTIAPKRRRTNHKKFDTSKCTSSKLYALWSSIEFAIEEEIIAVDQAALRFLMDAGERGYIAAYRKLQLLEFANMKLTRMLVVPHINRVDTNMVSTLSH